jgi:hypothetical protein
MVRVRTGSRMPVGSVVTVHCPRSVASSTSRPYRAATGPTVSSNGFSARPASAIRSIDHTQ